MHTQMDEVQLAVTLTPATTKAEKKKNKDMNGGTTAKILRDISYPRMRVIEGFRWDVAWHKCIF
jgi:hypothetical protein